MREMPEYEHVLYCLVFIGIILAVILPNIDWKNLP